MNKKLIGAFLGGIMVATLGIGAFSVANKIYGKVNNDIAIKGIIRGETNTSKKVIGMTEDFKKLKFKRDVTDEDVNKALEEVSKKYLLDVTNVYNKSEDGVAILSTIVLKNGDFFNVDVKVPFS